MRSFLVRTLCKFVYLVGSTRLVSSVARVSKTQWSATLFHYHGTRRRADKPKSGNGKGCT